MKCDWYILLLFLLSHGLALPQQRQVDSVQYYRQRIASPHQLSDLVDAYRFFKSEQEAFKQAQNTYGEILDLILISQAQKKLGLVSDSEQSAIAALTLLESYEGPEDNKKRIRLSIVNQLGMVYRELKDYPRARAYYEEALSLQEHPLHQSLTLNNIGFSYRDQTNYQAAIPFFKQAYSLVKAIDTLPKQQARVLHNLGFCEAKLSKPGALSHLNEALRLRDSLDYTDGLYTSYLDLSEVYLDLKEDLKAEEYAQKALNISHKTNNPQQRQLALERLLDLGKIGFYANYKKLTDSLDQARQRSQNRYAALKYNQDKETERANANALKLQMAQIELTRQRQHKLIFLFVGLLLLLSGVAAYYILRANHKKRTLEEVFATESRISKQVHDEVANEVFQLMMKVEAQSQSNPWVEELEVLYHKTRDISQEYALINSETPFETLLRELAQHFSNSQTNVMLKDSTHVPWQKLSDEKRITIYKVLQELLINMKKHSRASLAILIFNQGDKRLKIRYQDNGVGCDLKLGNGLQNTENRIQAIGGSIRFESQLKKGFKAELHV